MKFLPWLALALIAAGLTALAWHLTRRDPGPVPGAGGDAREEAGTREESGDPSIRVALPDGTELVLPEPPRRVLPANAAAVDFLMPLLSPERLAALPEVALTYSRISAEGGAWAELPTFGSFTAENLIHLDPDLVITHGWQSAETVAILRESGIAVLVLALPRTWEDIRRSLLLCGRAVGAGARAEAHARSLDERIERLRARTGSEPLRALSYSNLGTGGWAAGAETTADILFGLAGLTNAAAEAGIVGHATIDLERLLAIDPDLIVVGTEDAGQAAPPTEGYLRGQQELAGLRAIREDGILRLPPRLFTTSSTELLAGAELLVERVQRRRSTR